MFSKLRPIQAKKSDTSTTPPAVQRTGFGETLCCISTNGIWFRSSAEKVTEVISSLNEIASRQDTSSIGLAQLLGMLGVEQSSDSYFYGWRTKRVPLGEPLFKTKHYRMASNTSDITEPIIYIYSTTPAIKNYYKEEPFYVY